jgi:hypothetical protein
VVNADPELRQYVRNVKMSAEDQKARMRTMAAPIFAAQVRWLQLQRFSVQLSAICHSTVDIIHAGLEAEGLESGHAVSPIKQ